MRIGLKEIALEVSDQFGMSKGRAEQNVRAMFEIIAANVAEGHEVTIPGFGKFRRKDKAERQGRNPKTGEAMTIAAKSVPNFLPAKQLKEGCAAGGMPEE